MKQCFRVDAPFGKNVAKSLKRITEISVCLHVCWIGGDQLLVDRQLPAKAGKCAAGIARVLAEVTIVLIADREHAAKGGVGRVSGEQFRPQLERPGISLERSSDVAAQKERPGDVVVGGRERAAKLRVPRRRSDQLFKQGQRPALVLQRSREI